MRYMFHFLFFNTSTYCVLNNKLINKKKGKPKKKNNKK